MENVKLEVEEQQKFNFLLAQAAEFQQKIDIYSKALEDVQENAQEQMKEVQEKYELNGQAFHYDPSGGELVFGENLENTETPVEA